MCSRIGASFCSIFGFFPLKLSFFQRFLLNFCPKSPIIHNRKAETSTFRIQVSPSLSDPESGFSLYPQVAYSHLQPFETLFLQSRNPVSTNNLAPLAVVIMSVVLRQKLIFEPAKINIISHSTKHLRNFSSVWSLASFMKLGNLGIIF